MAFACQSPTSGSILYLSLLQGHAMNCRTLPSTRTVHSLKSALKTFFFDSKMPINDSSPEASAPL